MNEIEFAQSIENDWVVLKISGRLDTVTASLGEDEGIKALAAGDKLALDISGLEYISSAGLRVLLRIGKKAHAADKEFYLVGANGMAREVLEDSGLDVLFNIAESLKELT